MNGMPPAEGSVPPLTLTELQQLEWLLGGVLTLLSASTVFYLEINAWTLVLALTAAVIAGWWRPDWLARIPGWTHRLVFPFVVAFFAGDLWLTGELLPATVRLDLLLLLYRTITYRRRRDDLQVIVLGLFLIVLAGVLTVSLTFAVQLLAFAAGALAFLLTITLAQAAGSEAGGSGSAPPGTAPGWARHVDWPKLLRRVRAVTRWRVVAFGVVLFAGLVALSAVLFLAIPRFQLENGLFLDRFVTRKARTGFSDTIRFGEVTRITEDNSVALSVDVSDRDQIPAAPYWRMLVLDDYRDGTFQVSAGLRRSFGGEQSGVAVRGGAWNPQVADVTWTFYLESGVSRYLPLLGPFTALRFREPQNFRFARRLGVLELRADPVTMLAYRVDAMQPGANIPDPEFALRWREYHGDPHAAGALMLRVGLGEPDRAVLRRIDREITGGAAPGAGEFARRATNWLAQHHRYSLQPRIPAGSGDPLIRWLASGESGHCELFAGSLVLLARAAGIPARVVTGFRGGSWNGYSNSFTLRNSNAHAWCEVFDAATASWLRADPTPGSAAAAAGAAQGETALARRIDRSWNARWESLRVFWYRRIVNLDQRTQLDAMNAVKDAAAQAGRRLRELLDRAGSRLKAWSIAPWRAPHLSGWAAATAALIVLAWLARRHRFILFAGFGSGRRSGDAVRREAGRWLAKFQRQEPANPVPFRPEVIADLQRLRFGARETWPAPAGVLRRAKRCWTQRASRAARASTGRA